MNAISNQPRNASTQAGFPPARPEPHQRAGDVAVALTARQIIGLGNTPYRYLPLYARIAVERLDADPDMRTGQTLDELMVAYAQTMGKTVDLETCAAAHHTCARRFWNFQETVDGAPWLVR